MKRFNPVRPPRGGQSGTRTGTLTSGLRSFTRVMASPTSPRWSASRMFILFSMESKSGDVSNAEAFCWCFNALNQVCPELFVDVGGRIHEPFTSIPVYQRSVVFDPVVPREVYQGNRARLSQQRNSTIRQYQRKRTRNIVGALKCVCEYRRCYVTT